MKYLSPKWSPVPKWPAFWIRSVTSSKHLSEARYRSGGLVLRNALGIFLVKSCESLYYMSCKRFFCRQYIYIYIHTTSFSPPFSSGILHCNVWLVEGTHTCMYVYIHINNYTYITHKHTHTYIFTCMHKKYPYQSSHPRRRTSPSLRWAACAVSRQNMAN